jgi:hypothetical protein
MLDGGDDGEELTAEAIAAAIKEATGEGEEEKEEGEETETPETGNGGAPAPVDPDLSPESTPPLDPVPPAETETPGQ